MSITIDSNVKIQDSDDELQTANGLWNGIKFQEQLILKTVLKFVEILTATYKDFPANEVLSLVFDKLDDSEDFDALEHYNSILKRYVRKQKKRVAKKKFEPTGVDKPPNSAYNMYRVHLKEKAAKDGVKLTIKEMTDKWKSLSDESREVFEEKQKEAKAKYVEETKRQELLAMANGEIPMPKPKKPSSPAFVLRGVIMKTTAGKFTLTPEEKENLSKEEKNVKIKAFHEQREAYINKELTKYTKKEMNKMQKNYEKELETYKEDLEKWKAAENNRIAKLEAKAKSNADGDGDGDNENDADNEDIKEIVQTKAVKKIKGQKRSPISKKETTPPAKKKQARKPAKKVHTRNVVEPVEDSSSEEEEDEEEDEVIANAEKAADDAEEVEADTEDEADSDDDSESEEESDEE